eukprot:7984838-Ditylum_brightwellii.AAC.1
MAYLVSLLPLSLLGVCTKLVADINDILRGHGGGDCARVSCDNELLALDVDKVVKHDNGAILDNVKIDGAVD